MAKAVNLDLTLHPKQMLALTSSANEILYGGAAAGGKSHYIRAASIIWALQVAGLQIYIFRRHHNDLTLNHMSGPTSFPVLLADLVASRYVRIVKGRIFFGNGSTIHLCHCQHEQDVYKYYGAEMHVLILDEATHFSEKMFRQLRSRVRLGSLELPEQFENSFPKVLLCTNPGNIGHNWCKQGFVTPTAPDGHAVAPLEVWRTDEKDGSFLRQFIPARVDDNPSQSDDYAQNLMGLGSPELVKALLEGDWNVVAGGALDDVISDKCLIPQFKIPRGWIVDRCFDWGDTSPSAVLWVAEADGTEAPGGFCPPRGSLIVCAEWYGAIREGNGGWKGAKLTSAEIALSVLATESENSAWWHNTPNPGPADNMINTTVPGHPSIADDMAAHGVYWTRSDKGPGSRIPGLALMRTLFRESGKTHPERPGLWILENCRAIFNELKVLPRDPKKLDDVDSGAEDHRYDALRYRVLAMPRATSEPLRMW